MGNRAVITTGDGFENDGVGVYVHWNGGRDSIEGFLTYCRLRGFRSPDEDCYGWARLAQVISNFMGGEGLSVGVGRVSELDCDNGDNGVYIIEGWEIVGRECNPYDMEQSEYDLRDFVKELDSMQPEAQRIGADMIDGLLDTGLDIGKLDPSYTWSCAWPAEETSFEPGMQYQDCMGDVPMEVLERTADGGHDMIRVRMGDAEASVRVLKGSHGIEYAYIDDGSRWGHVYKSNRPQEWERMTCDYLTETREALARAIVEDGADVMRGTREQTLAELEPYLYDARVTGWTREAKAYPGLSEAEAAERVAEHAERLRLLLSECCGEREREAAASDPLAADAMLRLDAACKIAEMMADTSGGSEIIVGSCVYDLSDRDVITVWYDDAHHQEISAGPRDALLIRMGANPVEEGWEDGAGSPVCYEESYPKYVVTDDRSGHSIEWETVHMAYEDALWMATQRSNQPGVHEVRIEMMLGEGCSETVWEETYD